MSQAELLTFTFFPSSTMIVIVVWSANGDGSALTSKASSKVNFLNEDTGLCDRKYVIFRTNRARCPLKKEIFDLINEEAFLEHAGVELVYKFDNKSTASV